MQVYITHTTKLTASHSESIITNAMTALMTLVPRRMPSVTSGTGGTVGGG